MLCSYLGSSNITHLRESKMLSPSPFFEIAREKEVLPTHTTNIYKYSSLSVFRFGLNLESGPHM